MMMPNFLIIGAAKSATTSAYRYLEQHPQVFMSPVKEPNYFVYAAQNPEILPHVREEFLPVRDLATYARLFGGANGAQAVGEASHHYLIDPLAARLIRHVLPEAKLVVILRHPAERAFSAYWMHVRDRRDSRSFEQGIAEECAGRIDATDRWYVRVGFYARHLNLYLELFDRDQILVLLFDDLQANPGAFMRKLFGFIGVDDSFTPDMSVRHNASGLPANGALRPLLHKNALTRTVRRILPRPLKLWAESAQDACRSRHLTKPAMLPETRRRLIETYRPDVLELQDMIGRDLSGWLK